MIYQFQSTIKSIHQRQVERNDPLYKFANELDMALRKMERMDVVIPEKPSIKETLRKAWNRVHSKPETPDQWKFRIQTKVQRILQSAE